MKPAPLLLSLSTLLLASCASAGDSSTASTSHSSESSSYSSQSSSSGLPSSTVSSSSSSSSSSSRSYSSREDRNDFEAPVTNLSDKDTKEKTFTFHYDTAYFSNSNDQVDLDMAMFAFAMANAPANQRRAQMVFSNAGFDDNYDDSALQAPHATDSVSYVIGGRRMGDTDQIVVTMTGEGYGLEWVSNMYSAPKEEKDDFNGDHYGFHTAALKVIEGVRNFVASNGIQKAKYLFTGYSRGAAIAGLAAAMMIDDPIACTSDDVYGYTFASPAAMLAEHNKPEYNVVHNFLNENDFIPMFMPASFGYVVPGEVINMAEGVTAYGPLFTEVGFKAISNTESEFKSINIKDGEGRIMGSGKEVFGFLVDILTRELTQGEIDKGLVSYHTKEEYRDHLMEALMELMKAVFGTNVSFDSSQTGNLLTDVMELATNLYADDGFEAEGEEVKEYDPHSLGTFIKKFLDEQGLKPITKMREGDDPANFYDDAALMPACDVVQAALRSVQLGITKYRVDQGVAVNSARSTLMTILMQAMMNGGGQNRHTHDCGYALLHHYVESHRNA